MQCKAQPRVSPVYGETLGSKNPDGTRYRTKSEALEQCAADLIELAAAVYGIDLTAAAAPVGAGAGATSFAAFRWGGLLKAHRISAMEFPYSVEGLTAQHLKMRWPDIGEPRARQARGAVPDAVRGGARGPAASTTRRSRDGHAAARKGRPWCAC